jgi:hypothetical protein
MFTVFDQHSRSITFSLVTTRLSRPSHVFWRPAARLHCWCEILVGEIAAARTRWSHLGVSWVCPWRRRTMCVWRWLCNHISIRDTIVSIVKIGGCRRGRGRPSLCKPNHLTPPRNSCPATRYRDYCFVTRYYERPSTLLVVAESSSAAAAASWRRRPLSPPPPSSAHN